MSQTIKWIIGGIITLGALTLIAYAVKITQSAEPLWALILVIGLVSALLRSTSSQGSGGENEQKESPGEGNRSPAQGTGKR